MDSGPRIERTMSRADWQELIRIHCPKGKRPCNCGDAYETQERGQWGCEYGCSAAQIMAREYIAGILARRAADHASEGP